MANASEVARYIVRFFLEAGDPVTNLKLQKLLYYVQGWHLAVHDSPAFPEKLEAWVHGPVQPGVYRAYSAYRWNPIAEDESGVIALDPDLQELTNEVLDVYGGDSGYQLEQRTHREGPWLLARGGLARDEPSTAEITKESMRDFFKKLASG